MSENENKVCSVSCKIEHHAMMFAFLAKHAIELCGEAGKDAILAGMTTYGNERGARMAANALAHGDELTTMTNQAYGEWEPDYAGQMDFGTLRTEPTLQKRCEFDWGHPLSQEEVKELAEKKAKLGTSCMKDFNFHTAHLKYTVSQALILNLGEKGEEAVKLALADYVDTFGQEYLDVLNGLYPVE